jgi:hypothetical protein
MKTLGKLNINSEKILKNEELVNLRGGYDSATETACKNKKAGDECSYMKAGTKIFGKCGSLAGGTLKCY